MNATCPIASKPFLAPGPNSGARRILVVEDDAAIRQLNALILRRSGYRVQSAPDGAAGWKTLNTVPFDLLITDHDMPHLTGLELIAKIRTQQMPLPIILASGSFSGEELKRHSALKITAALLKPFSPRQLLETVQSVLPANGGKTDPFTGERFPTFHGTFRPGLPYPQWGPA